MDECIHGGQGRFGELGLGNGVIQTDKPILVSLKDGQLGKAIEICMATGLSLILLDTGYILQTGADSTTIATDYVFTMKLEDAARLLRNGVVIMKNNTIYYDGTMYEELPFIIKY